MKNKWYYNNYAFRLASPLLLGVVIYMLVLLFFDSVGELITNFFSREVLFVTTLTFIFLETNRLIIVILNKVFPLEGNVRLRILIQFLTSLLLSGVVVSLVLYFYFVHYVGFSTITTELITFNLIYFFVAVFYHLYYFSIIFLYKRNYARIQQETRLKENLEIEMEAFKNHVNPEFLFQSLETIISELHNNKKLADELINKLATVYRFTLENQHNELVYLKEETELLRPILKLFKAKYKDALQYTIDIDVNATGYVIPGTLQLLFEHAIFQNIVSTSIPLNFSVTANKTDLIISYDLNKKLKTNGSVEGRFNKFQDAYNYYSKNGIDVDEKDGKVRIAIPLLEMEEE